MDEKILKNIPPMLVGKELIDALGVEPIYEKEIKEQCPADRLIALNTIYDFYMPSNMSQEIYTDVYKRQDEIRDFVTNNGLSFTEGLLKLSNYEVDFKEQSASRSMIKAAAFPFVKELKDFDFEFQPSVNEQEMRELTNLGEDYNLFFQLTDMRYEKKALF